MKTTAAAGAGLYAYGIFRPGAAHAFYQTTPGVTPLWGTQLRGVGPGGIPVAAPDPTWVPGTFPIPYSLNVGQFQDQVHPKLGPTTFWGYNPVNPLGGGNQPQTHLGGIIVAQKGQPIQLTFKNNLPGTHIIPVDTTIMGAEKAQNRTATHLHGGLVPWNSDGGPFAWFRPDTTPAGVKGTNFGESFINFGPGTGQAKYYYPMQQSARMLWYHDHAIGITRINAYAGIASALLLRDSYEANLVATAGLPAYIENGGLELPIVVQDKIFVGPDIGTGDPSWTGPRAPGSLWYAHVYDTARYGKLGPAILPLPAISVVPEFFGDTMLANGTVFPQVTVQPRRYRLRILNACNARFLNLQLYVDDGTPNGITLNSMGAPTNKPARNAITTNPAGKNTSNWMVLGTEGGFLPNPVAVPSNVPFNGTTAGGSLLMAPAERADVLFDFSLHAGQKLILYSDTPAPFPMGDPLNDYFPGLKNKNPTNAITPAGFGPNTREIMRFVVGTATGTDQPLKITTATDLRAGNDPLLNPLGVTTPPPGKTTRVLTLNEAFDNYGRLIQMLGTDKALPGAAGFGRPYDSPATENVKPGDTEVWQIVNLTADTHPIHFHLVNAQIISRQALSGTYKGGVPNVGGAAAPPAPFEQGWKETVRMNPGEVTTVMMKFDLPVVPFTIPPSPRTGGNEYVWHCHILEHEEHDMMRPLIVG